MNTKESLDVDNLAEEIRRVDGNHSMGASALAEALSPYLQSKLMESEARFEKALQIVLDYCHHDKNNPLFKAMIALKQD